MNTNRPVPNVPLLRKCVEFVEAEDAKPDPRFSQWGQAAWFVPEAMRERAFGVKGCGSAYCVAGYAVEQTIGLHPDSDHCQVRAADGRTVQSAAADVLGLTYEDADMLFEGSNSAEMIRALAEEFAGEKL